MPIRPIRNWCLIKYEKREQSIYGGLLYLPNSETTPEKLSQGLGEVVALGPGDKVKATGIQVGDRVAYRSYLVYANPVDDHCVISIDDLLGVVSKDTTVGVFSSPATHSRPKEEKK